MRMKEDRNGTAIQMNDRVRVSSSRLEYDYNGLQGTVTGFNQFGLPVVTLDGATHGYSETPSSLVVIGR